MQGTERPPVETTGHHQAPGRSGGKEAWNTSVQSGLKETSVQGGLGQAPPCLRQLSALPTWAVGWCGKPWGYGPL